MQMIIFLQYIDYIIHIPTTNSTIILNMFYIFYYIFFNKVSKYLYYFLVYMFVW